MTIKLSAKQKKSAPNRRAQRGSGPTHNTQEFSIVRLNRNTRGPPGRPTQFSDSRSVSRQVNEELIQESVKGSVSFSCQRYNFNPGLDNLSWLKDIARKYERYRLKKAWIEFTPSIATWDKPGFVALAIAYDPANTECDSYQTLVSYKTKAEGPIHQRLRLNIDVKRVNEASPVKAVRMGPVQGDLRLYDPFSIHLATSGCDDDAEIGNLKVFYDLELRDPSTASPLTTVPNTVMWAQNSGNQDIPTSGVWYDIDFQSFLIYMDGVKAPNLWDIILPCGIYKIDVIATVFDADGAGESCNLYLRPQVDGQDLTIQHGSSAPVSVPSETKVSAYQKPNIGASMHLTNSFIFQTDGSRTLKMQGKYVKVGTFTAHFSGQACWIMATAM